MDRPEETERSAERLPTGPEYNSDGVDLTLIRWMLSLTPKQRLEYLDGQIQFFREAREHVRRRTNR